MKTKNGLHNSLEINGSFKTVMCLAMIYCSSCAAKIRKGDMTKM